MSAYQAIFSTIPAVVCILAAIGVLSVVLERRAIVARSILFSFPLWLAPLFYFVYAATAESTSPLVILAGCIELFFLGIYLVLFRRLFLAVTAISSQRVTEMLSYLKRGTSVLLVLAIPLFVQGGVGIFSKGSRIAILAESRLSLYLSYSLLLIEALMVPTVAAIINAQKRWCWPVVRYLLLISVLSILSASKGAVILALGSILSLIRVDHARDVFRLLWLPISGAIIFFIATVYFVGKFLTLSTSKMISVMFSRIFLANDCRALAIDWSRYLGASGTSLFRESFRLYAGLLGTPPKYPPLGQLLYTLQFGTSGMLGANTSSTALIIAYGGDLERFIFSGLLVCIAVIVGILADLPNRKDPLRLAVGILLISLLSQDFLAFQVLVNTLMMLSFGTLGGWILMRLVRLAAKRRMRNRMPVALSQS
ncbi:MAG: hypothetical protein JRN15_11420 [Nitrososphaerota archaeon]|nr:hypothetical protein [Nitrososphaerota archaeon]